jgi:hypothetical protein
MKSGFRVSVAIEIRRQRLLIEERHFLHLLRVSILRVTTHVYDRPHWGKSKAFETVFLFVKGLTCKLDDGLAMKIFAKSQVEGEGAGERYSIVPRCPVLGRAAGVTY